MFSDSDVEISAARLNRIGDCQAPTLMNKSTYFNIANARDGLSSEMLRRVACNCWYRNNTDAILWRENEAVVVCY